MAVEVRRARIVRLDAFAYLHKAVGLTHFFNEPRAPRSPDRVRVIGGTSGFLEKPEIHSRCDEAVYLKLAENRFAFSGFHFPFLASDAVTAGTW